MKTFITVLVVSVLYAISAFAMEATVVLNYSYFQQAGSNSLPDTTNKQELLKKIRESKNGSIRVIVTYDMEYDYSALANETQRQILRQDIETLHSRFLVEINSRNSKVSGINKSRNGPRVSLSVNKEALEHLYKMRMVKNIREVRYFKAFLDQSTSKIQADDSWEGFDIIGDGEIIVIIDTGVDYNHEMLSGKVIDGACFSTNDAGNDISSLCPNGQEAEYGIAAGDDCGNTAGCDHGTHVAGIAAGNGTNLKGVANGADIISIQVFSLFDNETICAQQGEEAPCILIADDDLEEGIVEVLSLRNQYNIAAINMSLGGGAFTSECNNDPLKNPIDNLLSNGIISVAASGNNNYEDALSSPACISSVVSVGATNNQDVHWSVSETEGSNAASFLDLVAPGVSINSAVPGGYSSMTGTSMAAPHVAGTVALMKEAYPNLLTSNYRSILQNTADDVSGMNGSSFTDEYGHGRLNTFEAIAEALKHNTSAGVFDYDYAYNAQQPEQFRDHNIYILPGYTLTVNGNIELYNSNIYVLGTLEGSGSIDLFGESDIYERLDGENNFMGDTTHYGDVYPVMVRNDFNGYYGGQIGVGVNTTPVSKSSPDTVFVSDGNTLNLVAYDNQTWNGYTWVFNNTEGSTNKSQWFIDQNQNKVPLSDSYNQSLSHIADEDQNAVIYNEQKRKFTITRNDYSPELGSNFNSVNVSVVEGNTLSAPATQTDNGITYQFLEWSDGDTDNQKTITTPTSSLTAHYKGLHLSSNSEAWSSYQNKVLRTSDGWEHMVYESMGHIWYEIKEPGQDWQLMGTYDASEPGYLDENGGRSPSIAPYRWPFPDYGVVAIAWQEGTKIKIQLFMHGAIQFQARTKSCILNLTSKI